MELMSTLKLHCPNCDNETEIKWNLYGDRGAIYCPCCGNLVNVCRVAKTPYFRTPNDKTFVIKVWHYEKLISETRINANTEEGYYNAVRCFNESVNSHEMATSCQFEIQKEIYGKTVTEPIATWILED